MNMLLSAVALTIASPVLAQTPVTGSHAGHAAPAALSAKAPLAGPAGHTMPVQNAGDGTAAAPAASTCTPEHAAMGHCKLAKPAGPAGDPHAGHKMSPKK